MSNSDVENRWRELAAQAANETDPTKLMQLVQHLCQALEAFREQTRPRAAEDVSSAD
jgi:hypothetical protein